MNTPKPRKQIRPRRRLKAALAEARNAGLLVREARIGPDGEVRIIIGSRTDRDSAADPFLQTDPNRMP